MSQSRFVTWFCLLVQLKATDMSTVVRCLVRQVRWSFSGHLTHDTCQCCLFLLVWLSNNDRSADNHGGPLGPGDAGRHRPGCSGRARTGGVFGAAGHSHARDPRAP